MSAHLSMTGIVEVDIDSIDSLRADFAKHSRRERRALIRAIAEPWLRMAVTMSSERWEAAKEDMRRAAEQIDAQV